MNVLFVILAFVFMACRLFYLLARLVWFGFIMYVANCVLLLLLLLLSIGGFCRGRPLLTITNTVAFLVS